MKTTHIAAGVLASLAMAAPAAAEPHPYEFTVPCGDFDNVVSGVEYLRERDIGDRHFVHSRIRETDTNSVTGKTLRLTGARTERFDADGTRTVTGKSLLMTEPGTGLLVQDAGRVVFDAPFHVAFAAGPHAPLYGDLDAMVCEALA